MTSTLNLLICLSLSKGWEDVPIIGVETFGAHSLNKSIKAGKIVENVMTSVAKTLGAPYIAPKVLENLQHFNVISEVQPDSAAVEACLKFAGKYFKNFFFFMAS